jgi:hypothetical protein
MWDVQPNSLCKACKGAAPTILCTAGKEPSKHFKTEDHDACVQLQGVNSDNLADEFCKCLDWLATLSHNGRMCG